jgi:NAD-dependent oxidoreductase involved in siderophore biosynthesis
MVVVETKDAAVVVVVGSGVIALSGLLARSTLDVLVLVLECHMERSFSVSSDHSSLHTANRPFSNYATAVPLLQYQFRTRMAETGDSEK